VSATVPVERGGRGIWALDVSLSLRSYEILAAASDTEELAPGDPVIWRGEDRVATSPIVELGGALIALMSGTLPPAPAGTWWTIGWDGGWQTIRVRQAPGD
jgi:hypothetical protein